MASSLLEGHKNKLCSLSLSLPVSLFSFSHIHSYRSPLLLIIFFSVQGLTSILVRLIKSLLISLPLSSSLISPPLSSSLISLPLSSSAISPLFRHYLFSSSLPYRMVHKINIRVLKIWCQHYNIKTSLLVLPAVLINISSVSIVLKFIFASQLSCQKNYQDISSDYL